MKTFGAFGKSFGETFPYPLFSFSVFDYNTLTGKEERLLAKHRVGVLGGYFDPFHMGHLRMALSALDGGYVDQVLVLPAGGGPDRPCEASRRIGGR